MKRTVYNLFFGVSMLFAGTVMASSIFYCPARITFNSVKQTIAPQPGPNVITEFYDYTLEGNCPGNSCQLTFMSASENTQAGNINTYCKYTDNTQLTIKLQNSLALSAFYDPSKNKWVQENVGGAPFFICQSGEGGNNIECPFEETP